MEAAAEDHAAPPAIHVARSQRAGRGRRGRSWRSPPGNLYATLVWPDPHGAWPPAVLAAIQLAVAEAVVSAGGPHARVKWPNDGWIAGGKWAGAIASRTPPRLLIGLGANLTVAPDLPGHPSAALLDEWSGGPDPHEATRLVLAAALEALRDGAGEIGDRLARWPDRDLLEPGETVRLETADGEEGGRYLGVDPEGRLEIEVGGEVRRIASGEVCRLRSERAAGPPAAG